MAVPTRVKLELQGSPEAPVLEFTPSGALVSLAQAMELGAKVRVSLRDPDGFDYWADMHVVVTSPELLGLALVPGQPAPIRQAFRRWAEAGPGSRRLEARLLSIPPDPEALRQLVSDLE